ncbi:MAG: hypothetical protein IJ615_04680 [Bacteroidaceae bacterium]|nr:hypothetical protein [Bacteroidaceae bacterium]
MKKVKERAETKAKGNARPRKQIPFPKSILPVGYSICFAVMAWFFLYVRNADTMYFLQDRGWWNSTRLFFDTCTSVPGGLLAWAGAYLTQFFYYPALGSAMLIALWLATFWLAKYAFRIADEWSFLLLIPVAALLCSDIQLGYWVYILVDVDYVFCHPLGLLAALVLSLPFWRLLPVGKKVKQCIALAWMVLVAALFYYPLGIYALLAAVLTVETLFDSGESSAKEASPLRGGLVGSGGLVVSGSLLLLFLTLWLVPKLETAGSLLMRPDQPWMYGFRKFELDELRDYSLEIPFYVALVFPVLFPFFGKLRTGKLLYSQGLMLVCAAAMILCLQARDFTDYNFHAEMRMQRAVEECRWNDVLGEAAKVTGPVTREMVMLRNIALINRGELCSKCYTYNNESVQPAIVSDSIHIRICDQAADLIYYNFGETVFAIRRAMERCMHYGYSYYTQRMLAQCAIVNGEPENARRYLRLLSRTTFQRKWAEATLPFVDNGKPLQEDERFRMPLRLYNEGSELVGTDDKYVELTIMKKWMYTITEDPVAQEVALGCAMMMRDRRCFWSQVQQHYNINPAATFPTHVQEAMLFEVYELKTSGVNLSFVKFDERIVERYKAFINRLKQFASQGMNEKQIGRALRPEFGDTYMWDYSVLREVQTN